MNSPPTASKITEQEFMIYTEVTDNPPEPSKEEIEEYAKRIGIDVEKEPRLLFLAKEGINHKLPDPWKPCLNKTRDVVFYFNEHTQKTQWEHPMDPIYRDRVIQARAELALSKIQNFDPLSKRPPNKDLPPIKRSGGSLVPISPVSSSLGKLGGLGPVGGDSRQRTPRSNKNPSSLKNDFSNFSLNNANVNNNKLGALNTGDNSNNIISKNNFKDLKDRNYDNDEDEEEEDESESSPSFLRPTPQKKGLTLTGGGVNFLKGSRPNTAVKPIAEKSDVLCNKKRDPDPSPEDEPDSDKKPIKSILVNSIPRCRPKNPSDNVYELDGFSMNLDEMTDEEKVVFSQLESSTASKSKGNVKFNLDENTELKFEMDDDDEMVNEDGSTEKTDEDEESESNPKNLEKEAAALRAFVHDGRGDSPQEPEKPLLRPNTPENIDSKTQIEVPILPEYSDTDIAAMKKAMREEMEEELRKFKDQLEDERKTRREQIQKHLDETIAQFKLEKDETLERIRKDMYTEKIREVDRAKQDIESLLQNSDADIEAMKNAMRNEMEEELKKFKEQLEEERKSRREQIQLVETSIKKHLDETIAQFKLEKEETLRRIRKEMYTEKVLEIDRAKREIEHLLQREVEEMKSQFDETLQKRRQELEEEHAQKIEKLTEEFKQKEEEVVKDITAHRAEKDSIKQAQEYKKQKKKLREDHQRIVEDAKAFIRLQKNRLKDPSPIPNSTHLILPTTKNNLLLLDDKLLKTGSPRRPSSLHLDLVSETESSGVSSLEELRSSERKKLSKDIDDICNSLNNLDQQMKLVWSVVQEKQQKQPYLVQDDSLSFLNATCSPGSSDFTAFLPNTVPLILGKSLRACASLPTSARKSIVPPTTPSANNNLVSNLNADVASLLSAGPRYSSLLENNQTSSSQTVLDALRMSGLSTTRLDCTDLLKSLEDELKEFKTTKQKLLEKGSGDVGGGAGASLDRRLSLTKQNNTSTSIMEKTKDLQEWLKKY